MYVFGGYGNSGYLNDLWVYDPQTDAWQQLSSGATPRNGHTAVAIDGRMYVFGGYSDGRLNDLWEYVPQTDAWQQLTSGATTRNAHSAVAIGGLMYVFGGYAGNRVNDLWDIS